MKSISLLFALSLLCSSCATITRGVHEKVKVVSDPPAADVALSSGETGVTPVQFVKKRKESFTVTVSKPGYTPQTIAVESRFSGTGGAAMAGNVLAGGVIGLGVDAASGATMSLYPNPVSVKLVPGGKSARKGRAPVRGASNAVTPAANPAASPARKRN